MDKNQAFVDPNAIEEAARSLEKFMLRIQDFDNRLVHELDRLGSTFQDEEYEKFRTSFESTRKLMETFSAETLTVLPKLREDAKKIRAAQQLKPMA